MAYTACGQLFKRPGPRQPRYSYRTMALCFQMDSLSELNEDHPREREDALTRAWAWSGQLLRGLAKVPRPGTV
jgi:hypothetical protein